MGRQHRVRNPDPAGVARLLRREAQLKCTIDALRRKIDESLVDARSCGISHKELAYAIQQERGDAPTAEELTRIEVSIRKRASVATRRVMSAHARSVARQQVQPKTGTRKVKHMTHDPMSPYRRRTVEIDEWYEPAPAACPPGRPASADPADHDPTLGDPAEYEDGDE